MLEDVAAEWLGVRLSDASLARFARDVERATTGRPDRVPERELRSLLLHARAPVRRAARGRADAPARAAPARPAA